MADKTPHLTGAGQYRLEYLGRTGWWVGHKGIDIADITAYVAGANKNGRPTRAVDKLTGEIIGDVAARCEFCGDPHTGEKDGSCLL